MEIKTEKEILEERLNFRDLTTEDIHEILQTAKELGVELVTPDHELQFLVLRFLNHSKN